MEGTASDRPHVEGKELAIPQSAEDFLDSFILEAEMGILKAAEEIKEKKTKQEIEKRIMAHYERLAAQALKKLWKLCGKQTNHSGSWSEIDSVGTRRTHHECKYCGKPQNDDDGDDFRIKDAIRIMAQKLRQLDKEAGMEYIP